MSLHTYDPKELSVIFGEFILRGFSDEQISITRDSPGWEMVIGSDGIGTRVKSNDRSATLTVTLQQSSPSNDELSLLANADELSNTGIRPLLIKDNLGTTFMSAATAFVEQIPEAAFGKTANDRVWTIKTDNLVIHLGGNP